MNWKPIGKRIRVRKCTTGDWDGDGYSLGGINVTQFTADTCYWAEIIDVSDDCELFTKEHIGGFVRMVEFKPDDMNHVEGDDWTIRERLYEDGHAACAVFFT